MLSQASRKLDKLANQAPLFVSYVRPYEEYRHKSAETLIDVEEFSIKYEEVFNSLSKF